jgi:hypothetical protein
MDRTAPREYVWPVDVRRRSRRRASRTAIAAAATLAIILASASALALAASPTGWTTLEKRIVPASQDPGFRGLELTDSLPPDNAFLVRGEGIGTPQAGREARRTSIAYFGQLSDFQLADEESPARAEFLDPNGDPVASAFRQWEAMEPHVDDAMIRQLNRFSTPGSAPVPEGSGNRPAMDFSINTGDSADSQQLNETLWVRTLIDGGSFDPNSGIDKTGYSHPLCDTVAASVPGGSEAALYTGVQDYDDYDETQVSPLGSPGTPYFYDPDDPSGFHAGWPAYSGLMDRAQGEFDTPGLVPSAPHYLSFGNHDGLVQGSIGGIATIESVATGCIKPMTAGFPSGRTIFSPDATNQDILDLYAATPEKTMLVPPDPARRYVSKEQYKDIFRASPQADGHGFDYVDPAEEAASNENAGYYSFAPKPGLRMIALDTIAEGGQFDASNGNLDDPQFRWLEEELKKATAARELVILFSHHAADSMTAAQNDEAAGPCEGPDSHGHDTTISCDIDPRVSTPIHLKADMVELLNSYDNVIAWVAGHSHTNRVQSFPDGEGHGFWSIRTAAEADWPQQARLLQLFDNHDGTLSIFGTIVDHTADATAPAPGSAAVFGVGKLASVARTLAYNDQQNGARACSPTPCGEGAAIDRNVELLIADPRPPLPEAKPEPEPQAKKKKRKCKRKAKGKGGKSAKGKCKKGKRKK